MQGTAEGQRLRNAGMATAINATEPDDPAAHPCEHNVELDMCDTWECSQKLNPNWPNNLKEN